MNRVVLMVVFLLLILAVTAILLFTLNSNGDPGITSAHPKNLNDSVKSHEAVRKNPFHVAGIANDSRLLVLTEKATGGRISGAIVVTKNFELVVSTDQGEAKIPKTCSEIAILHRDYASKYLRIEGENEILAVTLRRLGELRLFVKSVFNETKPTTVFLAPDEGIRRGLAANWRARFEKSGEKLDAAISKAKRRILEDRDLKLAETSILSKYGLDFRSRQKTTSGECVFYGMNTSIKFRFFASRAATYQPKFESDGVTVVKQVPLTVRTNTSIVPGHTPSGSVSFEDSFTKVGTVQLQKEVIVIGYIPLRERKLVSFQLLHVDNQYEELKRAIVVPIKMSDDGNFSITGVNVGQKYALQSVTRSTSNDRDTYWLVSLSFTCLPGTNILADLIPKSNRSLELSFKDISKLPIDESVRTTVRVFDPKEHDTSKLVVSLELSPVRKSTLVGLSAGVRLSAQMDDSLEKALDEIGAGPRKQTDIKVIQERQEQVVFDFGVSRVAQIHVKARVDSDVWIGLMSGLGDYRRSKYLRGQKARLGRIFTVPHGEIEIIAQWKGHSVGGHYYLNRIDIVGNQTVVVEKMGIGAEVSIRGVPDQKIEFGLPGHLPQQYRIPNSGVLKVSGLVPSREYLFTEGKIFFVSPRPGELLNVAL